MFFISPCSSLCTIHWSQVLSREWGCSWSSADRRCTNYIWVINNFIANQGASCIRGLRVLSLVCSWIPSSIFFKVASWHGGSHIAQVSRKQPYLISPWTKWPPFHRRRFHMHFHEENVLYFDWISLKFVPEGPIDNKSMLVEVMAWRPTGDKPRADSRFAPHQWETLLCSSISHWLGANLESALQAIIGTNAGPVYWLIYSALRGMS